MIPNREAFGGNFMIPIDQHNFRHYWPPTHVRCDCGELAQHVYRESHNHRYGTLKWRCATCERVFGLEKGTQQFYLLTE